MYLVPLIQLVEFIMATLKVQISFICMILMMYFDHTARSYKQLCLELCILLLIAFKVHLFQTFLLPMNKIKTCQIIIESRHSHFLSNSFYTRNQFYNGHVNKNFVYWEEVSICATVDPKILSNKSCEPRPMRNEQLAKFQT